MPVPVMTSWFHRDDRSFRTGVADLPFAILVTDQSTVNFAFIARPANSSGEIGSIKLLKPLLTPPGVSASDVQENRAS